MIIQLLPIYIILYMTRLQAQIFQFHFTQEYMQETFNRITLVLFMNAAFFKNTDSGDKKISFYIKFHDKFICYFLKVFFK